jgi:hypothetical protein
MTRYNSIKELVNKEDVSDEILVSSSEDEDDDDNEVYTEAP